MYQKQISQLVGEISSLAAEVNLSTDLNVTTYGFGNVNQFDVDISEKKNYDNKFFRKSVRLESAYFSLDRDRYEAEALEGLKEIKAELQKYIKVNPFQSVWEKFQHEIEREIVDLINRGKAHTEEQLFHDVMIATTGHEISLDCIYQGLKLTNGEEHAAEFKKEMLSNIDWLEKMVHMSGSQYLEEDAV